MSTLAVAQHVHFGHGAAMARTGKSTPSNRIAERRRALGLSMDQLAARVIPTTTSSVINKLEKGQRQFGPTWQARLAAALDCEPADLLIGQPAETQAIVDAYLRLGEPERETLRRVLLALSRG